MKITITNGAGLFLMRDGFNSYCFTHDEKLAENFESEENAKRVKRKLISYKGLKINLPEAQASVSV